MLYLDVSYFTVATAYANHATGSKKPFSVWKITTTTPKCFELGMYARPDYQPPARPERYCTDAAYVSEVFAKPTGFTLGWND